MLSVREELDTIIERATAEEIDKLNVSTFHPDNSNNCVYGQMTGFSASVRACEICPKSLGTNMSIDCVEEMEKGRWFTHLEMYLISAWKERDGKTCSSIVQYLKGEIQEIELPVYKSIKGEVEE